MSVFKFRFGRGGGGVQPRPRACSNVAHTGQYKKIIHYNIKKITDIVIISDSLILKVCKNTTENLLL
jgi:hypothetical protein